MTFSMQLCDEHPTMLSKADNNDNTRKQNENHLYIYEQKQEDEESRASRDIESIVSPVSFPETISRPSMSSSMQSRSSSPMSMSSSIQSRSSSTPSMSSSVQSRSSSTPSMSSSTLSQSSRTCTPSPSSWELDLADEKLTQRIAPMLRMLLTSESARVKDTLYNLKRVKLSTNPQAMHKFITLGG